MVPDRRCSAGLMVCVMWWMYYSSDDNVMVDMISDVMIGVTLDIADHINLDHLRSYLILLILAQSSCSRTLDVCCSQL